MKASYLFALVLAATLPSLTLASELASSELFSLTLSSGSAMPHLHLADARYGSDIGTTNFATACRISPNDTGANRDITCVAEIEELDLYFSELTAELMVPQGQCTYLVHKPYFFYRYEPGQGPTQLSLTRDSSGNIVNSSPGIDPETGSPKCQFDHSNSGGNNCCVGNYVLKTIQQHAMQPDMITITEGNWGGSVASCLDGPAAGPENSSFRDARGFPETQVRYVGDAPLSQSYLIGSAIQRSHGDQNNTSNVYAGNFYKPSQHIGGKPKALQFPANLPAEQGMTPQDSYEWLCMDRSQQLQARIRLFIREWNHGPITQGGNPDAIGTSPDFPENPINNYADWLDFGNDYPGRNGY